MSLPPPLEHTALKVLTAPSDDDKQIEVPIEEMCAACDNNGLALSPAAYKQLASLEEKTIAVQWDFST